MKSIPLSSVKKDNSNITYYSRPLWKALRKERFKPLTKEKYDNYVAYRIVSNTLSFNPYDDLEFKMDLDVFRGTLSKVQQQCFDYFLNGMPQKDISIMVGRTQGRVSKILQNVFKAFRDFYKEHMYE